jgi:GH24 family phage-related lysozyme (muramidase)
MCDIQSVGAEGDTLKIRIEEDGTITVVTGKIGKEVHLQAEQFLAEVQEVLGAQKTVQALEHVHVHTHRVPLKERKKLTR